MPIPEINERTLDARIKLYYDLYTPAGETAAAPAPLLIALHGYGSNKNWMMRAAREMAPAGFAVAALQGFHQHLKESKETSVLGYGFGWLTNFHPEASVALHHRAVLDLVGQLINEGVADRARVFLLGFSQTCALNYRFAFTHTRILRGVIGICGGLPGDWETSERYQNTEAAVLHLAGERDDLYPPARTADYASRLSLRAREVEFKSYDAAHELTTPMRDDVRAWLAARSTGD
jgi:phospholipase/carboxylesterase